MAERRGRPKKAPPGPPQWTTACPDWERRIVARESLVPCAPLFPEEAEAGLRVFRELRAVDVGPGLTLGDISRPWLLSIVEAIFGAYDPETGRRLIREFFLLIPKKQGKSTDAAGIILTALLLNWRHSAEMGILAPTIEVANNAWRPARDAIKADEELSALLHVQDHIRTITHRTTGATLQVVAADPQAVAGKKWAVTLVDELWLFGKHPTADRMLLEATGGMLSRPEGFVMYLSTQSDEPPAGVFKQKLDYARGVRDGRIVDPAFMPVLYEFPRAMIESGAARLPENFGIVNPNLGASVDEAELLRLRSQAQEGGEGKFRDWLAKHLNIEIGLSLAGDKWAGADFWEAQAREGVTLDLILERCDVATVGLDGGGLRDLYGLCVLGRDRETGEWLAWFKAFAHPSVIEYQKELEPRLRDFEKAGDLVFVKRVRDDIEEIARIVASVSEAGLFDRPPDGEQAVIGVDRNGIDDTLDELEAVGIGMEKVRGIAQGAPLMSHITTAERRLAGGELWHSGCALMNWCVGNAKTERKGNAVLVTKEVSKGKIDPLMALFNAVALMSRVQSAAPPEVVVLDIAA